MKDIWLYRIWGGFFIVCALLGFIPEPSGSGTAFLVLAAVLFFVPGGVLLYRAVQKKHLGTLRLLRNLSLIWLSCTLCMLILNFLSVGAGESTGQALYGFLIILSSPMVCGQYWIISLFGWALLLSTSITYLRKFTRPGK